MTDQDKVIVVNVNDLLPTPDELLRFALVFKNKDALVKVVGDETSEQRIEEFNQQCNAYDIDADQLYNSLFVSFVLYAAQQEVEINPDNVLTQSSETGSIASDNSGD